MLALPPRTGSCSVVHSAPSNIASARSAATSNQIHPPSLYWSSTRSNDDDVASPRTSRVSMRCFVPPPLER